MSKCMCSSGLNIFGTISSGTSGSWNLTKSGYGSLFLSNSNTYWGQTWIENGYVGLFATNALPYGTALTMGGSGYEPVLNLEGYDQTISSLNGDSSSEVWLYSVNKPNNTGTLYVNIPTGRSSTFSGCITGNSLESEWRNLYLEGGGTLNLSATSAYPNTWKSMTVDGSTLICH
jgi:autotransporter-associated beta strand protein